MSIQHNLNPLKKELIKQVIKPFFKQHGFSNKGINFYKDIDQFHIHVWIQSQRHYKEQGKEKFRIEFDVYMPEFSQKIKPNLFYGATITDHESSWIVLLDSSNFDEMAHYLQNKLEITLNNIMQNINIESMLARFNEKYFYDERYGFLLKKFQPQQYVIWQQKLQQQINHTQQQLDELEQQKQAQLQREKSLDQELLLNGLDMKINKLKWAKEKTQHTIDTINLIEFSS